MVRENTGKEINIVLVSTPNRFLKYMATAIESIYYNRNKNYNYNIYLFTLGKVTELDKKKLNNNYDATFCLKFVEIDEKIFSQYKNLKKKNYVYYIRLIVGNYLDNVDKILYMDCDIVVDGDISELFFTDLGNNVIGAVKDSVNRSMVDAKKSLERYFNSGVLLINLNLWKERKIGEKILNEINSDESMGFYDQDGLNYVLDGQWKVLSPKWNGIIVTTFTNRGTQYTAQEFRELNHPLVVHYAGCHPWGGLICFHSKRYLYFKYIFMTKYWDKSDVYKIPLRVLTSNYFVRLLYKLYKTFKNY